jgi:hypothetical protein
MIRSSQTALFDDMPEAPPAPRVNDRLEAAALAEVLKALRHHPLVAWVRTSEFRSRPHRRPVRSVRLARLFGPVSGDEGWPAAGGGVQSAEGEGDSRAGRVSQSGAPVRWRGLHGARLPRRAARVVRRRGPDVNAGQHRHKSILWPCRGYIADLLHECHIRRRVQMTVALLRLPAEKRLGKRQPDREADRGTEQGDHHGSEHHGTWREGNHRSRRRLAKEGDLSAARLVLERLVPPAKERPIFLALPTRDLLRASPRRSTPSCKRWLPAICCRARPRHWPASWKRDARQLRHSNLKRASAHWRRKNEHANRTPAEQAGRNQGPQRRGERSRHRARKMGTSRAANAGRFRQPDRIPRLAGRANCCDRPSGRSANSSRISTVARRLRNIREMGCDS